MEPDRNFGLGSILFYWYKYLEAYYYIESHYSLILKKFDFLCKSIKQLSL